MLAVLLQLLLRPGKADKLATLAVENYCVLPQTIQRLRRKNSKTA